jgi:ABC-type multidrug transport system fused ATPase/permease subunit
VAPEPVLGTSVSALGELKVLGKALSRDGRRELVLLASLTLLGAAAEFGALLALLQLLRSWLGSVEGGLGTSAALVFASAILAAGAIRFAILATTQRLAYGTGHRLLVAVQRRVLARPWTTHAAAPASGPLLAIEQVENVLYGILLPLLQAGTALVLGLAILAALLRIDPLIALVAGGLLAALFLLATAMIRPEIKRAGETLGTLLEKRIAAIQQHGGAMRELILAGTRGAAADRFRRIDRVVADARARVTIASGAPRLIVETLGLLALTAAAWWLAGRQGGLGQVLPTLAALALGAQRLLPLAQSLSNSAAGLIANRPHLRDLAVLLAEPDLEESTDGPPLSFRRDIRLEGVSFTYPGRDRPAVAAVDLVIRSGQRVALVGRNGSGKSSLADIVMGLLQPDEGAIRIDGDHLRPEVIARWHKCIAHVPQTPFLADGSIAENIAFMVAEPDSARVVEAARIAGLHDMIEALPQGYESRIGERGILLSGGQRQRLALARALYAPAPLLVLDEATSAIDSASEQHILEMLDSLQAYGTTILLIAHRTTMLERCDQVIKLEDGRVIQN